MGGGWATELNVIGFETKRRAPSMQTAHHMTNRIARFVEGYRSRISDDTVFELIKTIIQWWTIFKVNICSGLSAVVFSCVVSLECRTMNTCLVTGFKGKAIYCTRSIELIGFV